MTNLEEKLARQREKWRRAKARRRRAESDAKYGGRIETLEVLHRLRLLDFLIYEGVLAEEDVKIQARIDEATDALLTSGYYDDPPGGPSRLSYMRSLDISDGPCTVKVRMGAAAVDFLVEIETKREDERINSNWTIYDGPRHEVPAHFAQNLRSNRAKLRRSRSNGSMTHMRLACPTALGHAIASINSAIATTAVNEGLGPMANALAS